MPVVNVRVVGMGVGHNFMLVGMRMRSLIIQGSIMCMLVVRIMQMHVAV